MALDLKVGTVIFACPNSEKKTENDEIISKAKQYISQNNLTNKDVKILNRGGCIVVVTMREFAL